MQRKLFVSIFHKALVHSEQLTNRIVHVPASDEYIIQVFFRKLQTVSAALGRDSAGQRYHLKNQAFLFKISAHFDRIVS